MSGQLKVIKYFIKNSPVGEVKEVLDDIANIIGQEFLQHAEIKQALREYYESHLTHIGFNDGRAALINALGKQDPIQRDFSG